MFHAEKKNKKNNKGEFCKYLCDFVASFKPGVQCLHTCPCCRALQEAAVIVPLGTGSVQLSPELLHGALRSDFSCSLLITDGGWGGTL